MISTVSIVLALAVTFNAAIPVTPGNPGTPGKPTGSLNIYEKPRLDAFQKILPGEPKSRPEYLRITSILNFKTQNRLKVFPSIIGNTSLFQGRTYDPEVGLYYYRNRYYHPELGRFLQPDPMGYKDSMNLYQSFCMNPINFVDPFGLDFTKEQVDQLMIIRRDQGFPAAKKWIDQNINFTGADRLALHMKLLFGVYDPAIVEDEKYKTNLLTVMQDTIDGMAYDVAGRTYCKLAAAGLYHDSGAFGSFMFDLGSMGATGGVLKHYIPIGINYLKGRFPILKESVGELFNKGKAQVKSFFNNLFGKAPKNAGLGANSVNNAIRLKVQLALEEAGILSKGGQGLTEEAILESEKITIAGSRLKNPEVIKELTKIGGRIQDWGKYATKSTELPTGQRVQVHFYYNKVTGQVSYRPWYDFKVKGKIYLDKGLK